MYKHLVICYNLESMFKGFFAKKSKTKNLIILYIKSKSILSTKAQVILMYQFPILLVVSIWKQIMYRKLSLQTNP